ncbi:unnamed protein product, partial [Lymnaea stagnalis]
MTSSSNDKLYKVNKFFQTMKTIMTLHLQQMTAHSLEDYMHMFQPVPTSTNVLEHCGFVVNLCLNNDGSDIDFEPSFDNIEKTLLNMFDEIIKASLAIPRLERRMFPDLQIEPKYLQPV